MKKTIFGYILGLLTATIIAGATFMYKANEIDFEPTVDGWNPATVQDAIEELYAMEGKIAIDYEYVGSKTVPTSFPNQNTEYSVVGVECRGAEASWNNITWKLEVNAITGSSVECKVKIDDIKAGVLKEYTYEKQEPYEFIVPADGKYKIELWGSSGGNSSSSDAQGGKGAYTKGEIELIQGTKLYFYIGQAGQYNNFISFNGGGRGSLNYSGSGGGATDVRLVKSSWNDATSLRSRIMVAGAGGGAGHNYGNGYGNSTGGNAGGLTGSSGQNSKDNIISSTNSHAGGGTQISGGIAGGYNGYPAPTAGGFGYGGDENASSYFGGAGGSGYYGGGAGGTSNSSISSGGGGSSYISGHLGCVAVTSASSTTPKSGCSNGTIDRECSYHYSDKIFTETVMYSGGESMPNPTGTGNEIGHTGNGYAKITLMEVK